MSLFRRFEAGSAQGASPFEMRSSPRVAASLPAKLELDRGSLGCRLRDIGTGGVCVQTDSPFAMASLRRVAVELPDGPLVLEAEGCWQRETALERAVLTGVRFSRVEDADTIRLRKFIEQCVGDLVGFLQGRSELADLSLDEAIDVALASRLREARTGTYVLRAAPPDDGRGAPPPDSLFLVVRGSVTLLMGDRLGAGATLESARAGALFGGSALAAGVPSPFSAIADSDVTLLELDRSALDYLERAKPLVARRLSRAVARRLLRHVGTLAERLASGGGPAR